MIKLGLVTIQNFLSVENQTVDFSALGLCLVNGINGSGKSSIYRNAIEYLLFGMVPEKLRGDDFLSDFNKKDLMVDGQLLVGTDVVHIKRYRNHREFKNKLVVVVNGKDVSYTDVRETQIKINSLLGIDFETFESSTCFNNNAILFAESTSANRTALLSKILHLSKYNKALEKVKEDVVEVKNEIELSQHSISLYKNSLIKNETTLKTLELELKNFDTEKEKELNKLRRTKAKAEHDLKSKINLSPIKEELEYARKEVQNINIKINEVNREIDYATTKVRKINKECDILQAGKECTVCKQIMAEEHVTNRRLELSTQTEEIEETKRNNKDIYNELIKEKTLLQRVLDRTITKKEKAIEFNHQQELIQSAIFHINEKIEATDKPNTSILNYISDTKVEIRTIKKESEELEYKLLELSNKLKYLEFWVTGFGRAGIPNLIIEQSLSRLEEYTNRYLSGTGISLTLTSQKQLKSKKEKREQIDIVILNNGKERGYNNLSSGEKKRIDIALLFAICDLGMHKFNLMILDEVLDSSLDSAGADFVLEILRKKSKDLDSLIVISHQSHLQDDFDTCITVTKESGKSILH